MKYMCGWGFVGFIGLQLLVNFVVVITMFIKSLIESFKTLRDFIRKKCNKKANISSADKVMNYTTGEALI